MKSTPGGECKVPETIRLQAVEVSNLSGFLLGFIGMTAYLLYNGPASCCM